MKFYKLGYWITQIVLMLSFVLYTTFQVNIAYTSAVLVLLLAVTLLYIGIFLSYLQMATVEPLSNYAKQLRKMGKFGSGILTAILVVFIFLNMITLSGGSAQRLLFYGIVLFFIVFVAYIIGILVLNYRQSPMTKDERQINTGIRLVVYVTVLNLILFGGFGYLLTILFTLPIVFHTVLIILFRAIWTGSHLYINHLVYRYNQQNIKTSDRDLDLYIQHK